MQQRRRNNNLWILILKRNVVLLNPYFKNMYFELMFLSSERDQQRFLLHVLNRFIVYYSNFCYFIVFARRTSRVVVSSVKQCISLS